MCSNNTHRQSSSPVPIPVESTFNNYGSSPWIYSSTNLLLLFTSKLLFCFGLVFLANIHYQHDHLPLAICCLPLYLGRGMDCLSKSLFTFSRTQKRNPLFKGPFELSRQAIQALYSVFHEDRLMLKQMTSPMPLKRKEAIFPIQPYVQACLICLLTALNPSLNRV